MTESVDKLKRIFITRLTYSMYGDFECGGARNTWGEAMIWTGSNGAPKPGLIVPYMIDKARMNNKHAFICIEAGDHYIWVRHKYNHKDLKDLKVKLSISDIMSKHMSLNVTIEIGKVMRVCQSEHDEPIAEARTLYSADSGEWTSRIPSSFLDHALLAAVRKSMDYDCTKAYFIRGYYIAP